MIPPQSNTRKFTCTRNLPPLILYTLLSIVFVVVVLRGECCFCSITDWLKAGIKAPSRTEISSPLPKTMSFYEQQGWQDPVRQTSWEQPAPPSRSETSSVSQREESSAFAQQFDGRPRFRKQKTILTSSRD